MLKSICLKNFKCFCEEQEVPLSQVTIMYGKNGRGKSTVAQSLLLLAQTMQESNDIRELQLMGKLISLGNFDELLSAFGNDGAFYITLQSEAEKVEMGFSEMPQKRQLGRLSKLWLNDSNRFDVKTTEDEANVEQTESEEQVTTLSDIMALQNLKSLRYVAAERFGPRNASFRKDNLESDWVGVDGEYVINVLSSQGEDFQHVVRQKLSEILSGATLRVNTDDPDRIELLLNSKDGEQAFRPKNVGFGYSFVLPVIVSALLAKKGSLLIVENPEAHLHPGAQSKLMKFLIEVAKQNELQVIIETHSDHVVNGLRIAMKEGTIGTKDGHIVYFSSENDNIKVKIITSDKNGTLSDYPDDFLDEWTLQMLKLV